MTDNKSIKAVRAEGEGQGYCKRCYDNGRWNRHWMCFLYKVKGFDGCYCRDCVKEMVGAENDDD